MNYTKKVEETIDLISSDPESRIYKLINRYPLNDFEYLQMWFEYFNYFYIDQDCIREMLIFNRVDDIWFRYHLNKQLRELLKGTMSEKMGSLGFNPRLEQYLDPFSKEEQENLRKLILGYCYVISSEQSFRNDNLFQLGKKFDISQKCILSLSRSHPLFQDGIIELKSGMLSEDEPFHQKEIVYNTVVYSVFAGMEIMEEDLTFLHGSSLIELFNLGQEADFLAFEGSDTDVQDQEYDPYKHEVIEDGFENGMESLLRDVETECENEKVPYEIEYDETELTPYKNNLEYLYEEFSFFLLLTKMKEKKYDEYELNLRETEKEIFVLERNLEKQKSICRIRLEKSIKNGFWPRLEKLARKIRLTDFEKNVLLFLAGSKVFFMESLKNKNMERPKIGELIFLLVDSPLEQVKMKKTFYKNAKLIRLNLIQLSGISRLGESMFDCEVSIDNRLVEFFLGEQYDISEYIDGSYLYKSKICFDKVVLPEDIKSKVLSTISNFPNFLKAKKKLKFNEFVEYGNALVMLFVGNSGTGKTMLANAIANHLDQKILLFNMNSASRMISNSSEEEIFPMLFREARMNEALLFFDESENLLENRINDMLVEIERHEGIVIFATNAGFKIDEAMRRRINLVVEIKDPGPALRKKIWDNHLPEDMKLAEDLDLDALSRRFEINGGLIKNAVFSGLARAVDESGSDDPVCRMDHMECGANEQLQNKLFMSNLEKHKIPSKGLNSVVLPQKDLNTMKEIVNFEKAVKVLEGEWGFSELFPSRKGIAVLFHGPSGTGKTFSAEAIAYETGKTIKTINYAQVVSMWVGETSKALESLFKEVADNDSILLFDEADAVFAPRSSVTSSTDRYTNIDTDVLLNLIEEYSTFAVLTSNLIENIDNAFFRRMQYIVEFKKPDAQMRLKLWQNLIPPKMPISKDVDFRALAEKYRFTGGDIKNVVFRAAALKAVSIDQDTSVGMDDFVSVCEDMKKNKKEHSNNIGF